MSDEKPEDLNPAAKAAAEEIPTKTLTDYLDDWDKGKKADAPEVGNDKLLQAVANLSYKVDMDKIIPQVKGDLQVTDEFVEAYINMQGDKDSRLAEVWDNRDSRKAEFNELIKGLAGDFKKFAETNAIVKKDEAPADDDKGLAAAARIAKEAKSTPGLDDVNYGNLSDNDFELKKREIFRIAKGGPEAFG